MEENFKWLWAAFSLAWIIHLAYVFVLASQQKDLRNQIRDLKAQLEDRGSEMENVETRSRF